MGVLRFWWRRLASVLSITVCSFVLTESSVEALTVSTVARVSAMGGQYRTGSAHSQGVNLDAYLVPAIKVHPRLFLVPIYIRSVHQTQSVYSFLGEKTLVKIQADQTTLLRADWIVSSTWHIKPRFGYINEWLKQSNNESLLHGLFNYNRWLGGCSAEAVLGQHSFEWGYEYSLVRYPNYQSLASDPRLTTTGITQAVGRDVLNFDSHEASIAYDSGTSYRPWNWNGKVVWVHENFGDQKVITQGPGGFEGVSAKQRADNIVMLLGKQTHQPVGPWFFGFGETWEYYLSNQNAFDAAQTLVSPFTPHYYDFWEMAINPFLSFSRNRAAWEIRLDGNLAYRQYLYRRTQNQFGAFQEDSLIYTFLSSGTLTCRRHLYKGFYAILTTSVLQSSSNTRYEANYPYNYTVWTYLGGISWEH